MSERAQGRVTADQGGQTLAAVVRALLGGVSWNRTRRIVQRGRVQLDGQTITDPARRVQAGQTLAVAAQALRPRDPEIVLLHVDPDLVVVDKPAGLCSVPYDASERDTLLHRTHAALRRREGGRHLPPLRVVQRLDKDTSGVLVFARNRRAERGLGEQFRRHTVERRYLGLCYGLACATTHDTWLVTNAGGGRRGSVRGSGPRPGHARRAVTHVTVRGSFRARGLAWTGEGEIPGISIVACTLETGRQHQIRIHLGEDGTPLVGERVYDRHYHGPRLQTHIQGRGRPMLHAATLGFVHPTRDLGLRFESDLPSDFADLLRDLGARTAGSTADGPRESA
ncbi:MAG: RluA family pseudouridine synthase [Myxococcota bacterium]